MKPEVIKLQLCPFSLRDVAATLFESLPYGLVNNLGRTGGGLHEQILPSCPHFRKERGNYSV